MKIYEINMDAHEEQEFRTLMQKRTRERAIEIDENNYCSTYAYLYGKFLAGEISCEAWSDWNNSPSLEELARTLSPSRLYKLRRAVAAREIGR